MNNIYPIFSQQDKVNALTEDLMSFARLAYLRVL